MVHKSSLNSTQLNLKIKNFYSLNILRKNLKSRIFESSLLITSLYKSDFFESYVKNQRKSIFNIKNGQTSKN